MGCKASYTNILSFIFDFGGQSVSRRNISGTCVKTQELVTHSEVDGQPGTTTRDGTPFVPGAGATSPVCGQGCIDGAILGSPAKRIAAASGSGNSQVWLVNATGGNEIAYFAEELPTGKEGEKVLRITGPDNVGTEMFPKGNAFFGIPLRDSATDAGSYFFVVYDPKTLKVRSTREIELPGAAGSYDSGR